MDRPKKTMKEREKGKEKKRKHNGVLSDNSVFEKQQVSLGSTQYRTIRVDKDEKVLNLESSGSLIMPAGEMEGMGREEAEAAN